MAALKELGENTPTPKPQGTTAQIIKNGLYGKTLTEYVLILLQRTYTWENTPKYCLGFSLESSETLSSCKWRVFLGNLVTARNCKSFKGEFWAIIGKQSTTRLTSWWFAVLIL
jgi:hypothetical protein